MALTPKDSELLLKHLQLSLATTNQKIAQLQTYPPRLYDYCWSTGAAPSDLLRSTDAVTGDNCEIYLRQGKSQPSAVIHRYNALEDQWLESVPFGNEIYRRFSMIYHEQVILIGGSHVNDTQCGNEIFVLPLKVILHMPTKRCRTTSLKYVDNDNVWLIVIGGENSQENLLKTVEIINLNNIPAGWKTAQDIPETLSCSSGTIVNGFIYLLGGWTQRDVATPSVFRCSVEALIATAHPNHGLGTIWETLPNLPVEEAACTSFNGRVMVVGGKANTVAVRDIRTYNEVKKRWDVIGYLPNPRYNCFAIGLDNKLIVIGGAKDKTTNVNTIEIYQEE